MAKYRIEAAPAPTINTLTSTPADSAGGVVNVVAEKNGSVNWLDRIKSYYHTLITLVGTAILVLNAATPAFDFIPIDKNYLTVVIATLTTVSVFLKKNETWVDEL